jgi:ATP-dependent Clp protease ATP-binding subunit ClpA
MPDRTEAHELIEFERLDRHPGTTQLECRLLVADRQAAMRGQRLKEPEHVLAALFAEPQTPFRKLNRSSPVRALLVLQALEIELKAFRADVEGTLPAPHPNPTLDAYCQYVEDTRATVSQMLAVIRGASDEQYGWATAEVRRISLAHTLVDRPEMPLRSPRLWSVLEAAATEAKQLGLPAAGTDHFLLAVAMDEGSPGAEILRRHGAMVKKLRELADRAPEQLEQQP